MHPREMRQFLKHQFPLDGEFDAFVQDYFMDVYTTYSSAMDREQKINYLLIKKDISEVIHALGQCTGLDTTAPPLGIVSHELQHNLAVRADVERARVWILKMSLLIVTAYVVLFIIAPFLDLPLEMHHSIRIIQLLLPVFLGYIGSGYRMLYRRKIFSYKNSESNITLSMLSLLVKGPIFVF